MYLCGINVTDNKKNAKKKMTITTLSTSYFHAMLPEVRIVSSAPMVLVEVMLGTERIYGERLYPQAERIDLQELPEMVEPWLRDVLTATLTVRATEMIGEEASGTVVTAQCRVVYGNVDMDATCQEFCEGRFLTLLEGEKRTAEGRLEYLHFIGQDTAMVDCRYSDGTTATMAAAVVAGGGNNPNGNVKTLDVSPGRYGKAGVTLVAYTVRAGRRRQDYVVDLSRPDCAPVLLFTNSFGCQELIYCIGKHEVKPEYGRQSARVKAMMRNYRITEQRNFEADTGTLTVGEMNWVDELFRSMEVYVVNFAAGVARVGKEVLVLSSKSDFSNEVDALNRATFRYTYAQRCHNIVDTRRAGRVFDNTFDNTFD